MEMKKSPLKNNSDGSLFFILVFYKALDKALYLATISKDKNNRICLKK